jgi:hypothetical protein
MMATAKSDCVNSTPPGNGALNIFRDSALMSISHIMMNKTAPERIPVKYRNLPYAFRTLIKPLSMSTPFCCQLLWGRQSDFPFELLFVTRTTKMNSIVRVFDCS